MYWPLASVVMETNVESVLVTRSTVAPATGLPLAADVTVPEIRAPGTSAKFTVNVPPEVTLRVAPVVVEHVPRGK